MLINITATKPTSISLMALIKFGAVLFYCFLVGAAISVISPVFAMVMVLPVFIPLLMGNLFSFGFPINLSRNLLLGYFLVMAIWPGYLAVQLPGPDLSPQRLLLGLFVILFGFSMLSLASRKFVFGALLRDRWWVVGFSILFFHRFVSAVLGMGPLLSVGMVLREFVEIFFVGAMAYILFSDFKYARRLFFVFMVCGLVASLLGCIEFVLKRNLYESISIPGMSLDPEYVLSALSDKTRGERYRAQGAFFHPLLLAEFCAYSIPLAFYFLFFGKTRLVKGVGGVSVLVIPVGAFLTGSRSAFLVTAILFFLCFIQIFWMLRKSNKNGGVGWFLLMATLALLFVLIPFVFYSGIADNIIRGSSIAEVQSTNARIRMYMMGIPAIFEAPIFGYGVGFASTVAGVARSIDSFYLSFALESGLVGLFILMSLLVAAGIKGVEGYRENRDLDKSMFPVALLTALIGSLLVKLILSLNGNSYLLIVTSGVLICTPRWVNSSLDGA